MTRLKSKFSFKHVVVFPIIFTLFFCSLILIISFVSFRDYSDGQPLYLTPIWVVLLFIVLFAYTTYHYIKSFKSYKFFDKGFEVSNVFGKKFYSWHSIKVVYVVNNSWEKILWQYLEEDALTIYTKSGERLDIFSKYYSNMPRIRQYFNLQESLECIDLYAKPKNTLIKPFSKETVKGTFLLTLNGFLVLFVNLLFLLILIDENFSMTIAGYFFIIGLPMLIAYIIGKQSYYFKFEKSCLTIKNHVFFYLNHEIELDQVRVIYFEQKFKKAPAIRVVYDDYSSVSFQADSIKKKQWKSLIIKLINHGIAVEDKLFYY